jgi:hypothetical protein
MLKGLYANAYGPFNFNNTGGINIYNVFHALTNSKEKQYWQQNCTFTF